MLNWNAVLIRGAAISVLSLGLVTTPAQATNTASATCTSLGAGTLVADGTETTVTLAEGDVLTITYGAAAFDTSVTPPGAGFINIPPNTTQSFTVAAAQVGDWVVGRSDDGGSVTTLSCVLAADVAQDEGGNENENEEVAPPSTADVQNAFSSRMMMSHLGNLYDDMHRNTSGVLNGTGASTVSGNGFFLQSIGKAAKDIPGTQPALNVFVSAEVTSFEGDTFDGLTGDLTLGLDYRVTRDVVVGGLVSAGRADFSTLIGTNVGSLENTGFTVGLYGAAKVFGDVTVDGLMTYSGLSYDVANATTTGDFDASRFGVSIGVYNQLPFMGAIIEPHARVVYGIEEQDSYTDSAGRSVGSNTVNAGRIVLGPRLIAPMANGFTPWISTSGVYEFSDSGNLATGAPDFDETFSGTVGLGFDWASDLGRIGGELEFGGLGSGLYHSISGTVQYTLEF